MLDFELKYFICLKNSKNGCFQKNYNLNSFTLWKGNIRNFPALLRIMILTLNSYRASNFDLKSYKASDIAKKSSLFFSKNGLEQFQTGSFWEQFAFSFLFWIALSPKKKDVSAFLCLFGRYDFESEFLQRFRFRSKNFTTRQVLS